MKALWIVGGLIVLLVVGVGGMAASKWNQLVTMDTDIKAKWARWIISSSGERTSFLTWWSR